jgi:flavin-dependent dehydrogenase
MNRKRFVEFSADIVICGGGLGGCASAMASLRNNLKVILTEETDRIGCH